MKCLMTIKWPSFFLPRCVLQVLHYYMMVSVVLQAAQVRLRIGPVPQHFAGNKLCWVTPVHL